jgi:Raf kinase inhibitor-like YbhB/YbcL family protein
VKEVRCGENYMKKYLVCMSLALACLSTLRAQESNGVNQEHTQTATLSSGGLFKLTSSTFANDTTLPISTIHNMIVNNVNVCSIDGSPGGNQSPELSWSGAPRGTQTFVMVVYDVTAGFTHWGMYNIAGSATGLPANAGVAGSQFGKQIFNDFFIGAEYDGPCPPEHVAPDVHHYIFTVYALDVELHLPSSPNFPAGAERLYHALIAAGRNRHILGSTSLTGLYSATPPPPE